MTQFDVYENSSKQTRKAYPYILDIQHTVIAYLNTRIVVPLGELSRFKNEELKGLTPKIKFEETELLILTPKIASIPAKVLQKPIGTLSHLRDEIIGALDFAITGI